METKQQLIKEREEVEKSIENSKSKIEELGKESQHAGSNTSPYSYNGNIKEELKVEGKYDNPINATFTEWKKILEGKDPTKLKEIDLENEDVQSITIKHKNLNW